jgi:hypothetical protein
VLHHDRFDSKFTRRAVVGGAAAGTLALATDPASAQRCPSSPPPRAQAPFVWRKLDQQELDEAYDPSVFAFRNPAIKELGSLDQRRRHLQCRLHQTLWHRF